MRQGVKRVMKRRSYQKHYVNVVCAWTANPEYRANWKEFDSLTEAKAYAARRGMRVYRVYLSDDGSVYNYREFT